MEVGIAIRRPHLARRLVCEQRRPLFCGRVRHAHIALEIVERGVWIPGVVGSLGFEVVSNVLAKLCRHVRQLLRRDWNLPLIRFAPDRPIGSCGLSRVDVGEVRLLQRQRVGLSDNPFSALGKERAEVVGESILPGSGEHRSMWNSIGIEPERSRSVGLRHQGSMQPRKAKAS